EVIVSPKLPNPTESLVSLLGCVSLPTFQNLTHWCAPHLDQHMHMIGHDYPSQQLVLRPIMIPKIVLDDVRDRRLTQMASTQSSVKICLELPLLFKFILQLQQGLPLAAQIHRHRIG